MNNQDIYEMVRSLQERGVNHAVISPGSRNFPIIQALVSTSDMTLHEVIDERSAGYHAIGLSIATDQPTIITCTSGTAALNYYPAIAEAFYAEVPLIVLTADRPPEAIDNWEGQSVRQKNVFASHTVKSFHIDPGTSVSELQNKAEEAYRLSIQKAGPVHINIAFREPFYDGIEISNNGTKSHLPRDRNSKDDAQQLLTYLPEDGKLLWLNGHDRSAGPYVKTENVVQLSDVLSNKMQTINHWEAVLPAKKQYLPSVIITTGTYFVSKQLRNWLKQNKELVHVHLGSREVLPTPFGTKPIQLNLDYQEAIQLVNRSLTDSYRSIWEELGFEESYEKISADHHTEIKLIEALYEKLPSNSHLHLANSTTVRNAAMLRRRFDIRHLGNRGTSGIDGCTSTAVGYASATDEQVFLFTGDLAFLYDINGLWRTNLPQNLKIVVFNNFGGGIFELIDGPDNYPETLKWQVTAHNKSVEDLTKAMGVETFKITAESDKEIIDNFFDYDGCAVLEIETSRDENKSYLNDLKRALRR